MNLLEEKNDLIRRIKIEKQRKKSLEENRDKKLNEIDEEASMRKKKINDSYSIPLDLSDYNINSLGNKLMEIENMLDIYYTFDINELGPILANLLSVKTNQEYIYDMVTIVFEEIFPSYYGISKQTIKVTEPLICKKKKYRKTYIQKDNNFEIYKDEDLIWLYKRDCPNGKLNINFNRQQDVFNSLLEQSIILKFINYVIEYRIENNKIEINQEDLNQLLSSYLNKTKTKKRTINNK